MTCPGDCVCCPTRPGERSAALGRFLPRVPVRHFALAVSEIDPQQASPVSASFAAAVFADGRHHATIGEIGGGAVTAVHRNGPSERDATIHLLALDGVYTSTPCGRVFVPNRGPPSRARLDALTRRLGTEASAVRLSQRLAVGPAVCARVEAGAVIDPDDDVRRRDVVGLLARSPTRARGEPRGTRLRHRLLHPFSDGTTEVEVDALDFGRRLRQLAPTVGPVAYHGVLAAPAGARWRVVGGGASGRQRACAACPGRARLVRFEETRADEAQMPADPASAGG